MRAARLMGLLLCWAKRAPERTNPVKIDGACHCGTIRIEGEADPDKTQICHCTDCQTGTGSAFRVSVPVSGDTFRMTGAPTSYLKTTADSGNPRVQAFCPNCGSPIYSTTPGDHPRPSYTVRVGILRDGRGVIAPIRRDPRLAERRILRVHRSE